MSESRDFNFHGIVIRVRPDAKHQWTLSTEDVAAGYGLTPQAIRNVKARHADELENGQHFASVTICVAGQETGNPDRLGLQRVVTTWTKRGVLKLGMFLTGDRAKLFREWLEDLALEKLEGKHTYQIPTTMVEAAEAFLEAARRAEAAEAALALAAPKAAALDALCGTAGHHTIAEAAKILTWGELKLFKRLRELRILQHNNLPYQQHLECGRFIVRERPCKFRGVEQVYAQTFVTAKGLVWLREVVNAPLQIVN